MKRNYSIGSRVGWLLGGFLAIQMMTAGDAHAQCLDRIRDATVLIGGDGGWGSAVLLECEPDTPNTLRCIAVTARHVLEHIKGFNIHVDLRAGAPRRFQVVRGRRLVSGQMYESGEKAPVAGGRDLVFAVGQVYWVIKLASEEDNLVGLRDRLNWLEPRTGFRAEVETVQLDGRTRFKLVLHPTEAGHRPAAEVTLKVQRSGADLLVSRELWTNHPTDASVDLAGFEVQIPRDLLKRPLTSADLAPAHLAGIKSLDQVQCLGYPIGIQAPDYITLAIRTSRIASYPFPRPSAPAFYVDADLSEGHSGGPCVVTPRETGRPVIAGLVQGQAGTWDSVERADMQTRIFRRNGLGIVISAVLVRELVEHLLAARRARARR